MPIEIEAKMQVDDVDSLRERLREVGAAEGITIHETNTFYDTQERKFKSADEGLRIREEKEIDGDFHDVIITHKGPRAHGKLKSRQETEVHVNDLNAASGLLTALGFRPVLGFEKRRQRWTMDQCEIVIDELPFLGRYIEIEGPDDESVLCVREKIGLSEAPIVHSSYISMLRAYLLEHELNMDFVKFQDEMTVKA